MGTWRAGIHHKMGTLKVRGRPRKKGKTEVHTTIGIGGLGEDQERWIKLEYIR